MQVKPSKKEILQIVRNGCFYTALIIEIFLVIADKSDYLFPYEGQVFRITFVLFGIVLLATHYTFRERGAIVLFLILGVISYMVTGRNEMIRVVVMIAACKSMDMKLVVRVLFWGTLMGCIVIVGASVSGIFGKISLSQQYEASGIDKRYTFGMGHPNSFYCMVWALMLLGMYVYYNKMKWYTYGLLLLGNVGVFCLTKTLTCFLVAMITLATAALLQYYPKFMESRAAEWISQGGIVLCVVVSVLGAANASQVREYYWGRDHSLLTQAYVYLDKILTGRLLTLACTVNAEGTLRTWRLFSTPGSTYYFDLGWVRLFYWYGIIPALISVVILMLLLHYCYRKKDAMGVVMILTIAIYTIVEAHVVSVYIARNYLLFLLGMYWYQMLPPKVKNGENV